MQPGRQLNYFIFCMSRKASATYLLSQTTFSVFHILLKLIMLSPISQYGVLYHLLCLQKLLWKLSHAVVKEGLQPVNLLLVQFSDLHINILWIMLLDGIMYCSPVQKIIYHLDVATSIILTQMWSAVYLFVL